MTGRIRPGVAALACCVLVGLLVPVPALAGDGSTVFTVEPDELDVDPGEEFDVEVVVSEHGDLQGNGIDALAFDLEYDTEHLTVTGVEHESMLAAGDDDATVEGTHEIDDQAGVVSVDQERKPSGDGARGHEAVATITFEVDEDAEPVTTTASIADASVTLVTDLPKGTFERSATIDVDGGDESDEDDGNDEPEGVTLADDDDGADTSANEDDDAEESADDGDGAGDAESIPGFAVPAAIGGIGAFVWYRLTRR